MVRAESSFSDEAILSALKAAELPYTIVAQFTSLLQAGVYGLTLVMSYISCKKRDGVTSKSSHTNRGIG